MNNKLGNIGSGVKNRDCMVGIVTLACIFSVASTAWTQQDAAPPVAAAAPTALIATEDVRPAADRLAQALSIINPAKWKAPSEVKGQTQADIASIQRNLKITLPDLLDQAKADPSKVAPAFAVYRNLSALYDVLLRVAETATLAGPQQDGASMDDELRHLEAARKSLGASILDVASAHDMELIQLRAANARLAAQQAAAPSPAKKVVVNDGPAASTTVKKKRKPVATVATPSTPAAK